MSFFFKFGCVNLSFSIIMASVGGHKPWELQKKRLYDTAFIHHMLSGIGMIVCGLVNKPYSFLPFILFIIGNSCFSGVLYYRCFKEDTSLNKLMPIGGSMNILGWLVLGFIY